MKQIRRIYKKKNEIPKPQNSQQYNQTKTNIGHLKKNKSKKNIATEEVKNSFNYH